MSVIQFPPQPPQDGLTDAKIQDVVAWAARASSGLLEVTPVSGCTEDGARFVSLLDDAGEPKWTVCREGGSIAVLDGDPNSDGWGEAVPRGTSRVVEGLWEALGCAG